MNWSVNRMIAISAHAVWFSARRAFSTACTIGVAGLCASVMSATVLSTVAVALPAAAFAETAECSADQLIVSGDFGEARFSVEVMDDNEGRARGLMNRPSLATSAGMLFVYDRPRSVSFWMENTLIPLDMIFTDGRGVVTRIHENAIPLDRTPIFGGDAVFAVLEISGGLSAKLGLEIGDRFQHPAFGPDASMPCFPN